MQPGNPEQLLTQGYQARRDHRLADARALFAEAVDLSRAAGPVILARSLTALAQVERDLNNLDAALALYQQAAALYRALSDPLKLAHTVRHAADILRHQNQLDRGATCYIEALDIYRANPQTQPLDLANTLRGFALLKTAAGKNAEAAQLWSEARQLYAEVNVQAGIDEADAQFARLAGLQSPRLP